MNLEFNRNEDQLKQSLSEMRRRLEKIYEGGGKKAIEKQREKNKLSPRERIDQI
jgi:acetyl-CoA carboxylase carboxyltransferase component